MQRQNLRELKDKSGPATGVRYLDKWIHPHRNAPIHGWNSAQIVRGAKIVLTSHLTTDSIEYVRVGIGRRPGKRQSMIRFLKNRVAGSTENRSLALGSLELELMEILWANGEHNVRDVVAKLSRPLAYTTVMTTLDRLFKKGLLDRHKSDRAFFYSPSFSRHEWERRRAGNLVAGFLSGPHPSRDLLLSCLLDAVGQHDATLLDELEKKIRSRRKELSRQGQP
jgi:predicted transcriptional regulator